MNDFFAKDIRNIAVIGHSGEGKTTLTEAMLYNMKAIDRQGKTADGNTVSDYDPEEISRKISISMSLCSAVYRNTKFNIIDVPGFFDFEGEQLAALRVVAGAVIVAGAQGNISVGAEKALKYCLNNKIPTILFLNGIDKENSSFIKSLEAYKALYPTKIAPLQMPIIDNQKMKGYIDMLTGKAFMFSESGPQAVSIPDSLKADYETAKGEMTEVAASNDDSLMEKFFNEEPLTNEEIIKGIKAGIRAGTAIPVIAGSALYNRGVFNLMDDILDLIPSPAERGIADDKAPFSAYVFKTVADPFVGKLSLFKVMSGTLKNGMTVLNPGKDKQEKIGGICALRGKKQDPVNNLYAGDIGAVAKLNYTSTGDTLCDEKNPVRFDATEFPPPVIAMAVSAAKQGDEDKVFGGIAKLQEEDPTFRLERDSDTGEMLLKGMGETQLEIIIKKLKTKYGADAVLKTPKIPYRETIKKKVEARGKHKKQSGGHGQYGDAAIRFEPSYDADFEFVDEVVGGVVPKSYIPAVEKGLRECIQKGVLAGYPVVRLKCTLFDGSYHDVDSSEMAFKIAASIAFKEGLSNAGPVLLEPIYTYKIKIPENYLGDIMGDVSRRRGRILGMDLVDGEQTVSAEIPFSEMTKYATDLRSMTQGRGSFTMEYTRYEEVPAELTKAIVDAAAAEQN